MIIASFLRESTIDILAMVHHKHGFLNRLVHEPVIQDVSIYADKPFLILPNQDR